jgi:hypothetical protein
MSDRSARQIFPETEIVDAWALLQELGLSSLDVSNGERVVGTVTPAEIEQHRASGERTFSVGSIMKLPPEIVGAPRARHAGSVRRDGTRTTSGTHRQIASGAAAGWALRRTRLRAPLRPPLEQLPLRRTRRATHCSRSRSTRSRAPFRLRTRLVDLDPELVPGDGDTWHVRLACRQEGMEVHEALTRVREWLVEEELSAAIVRIGGARQVVTLDS